MLLLLLLVLPLDTRVGGRLDEVDGVSGCVGDLQDCGGGGGIGWKWWYMLRIGMVNAWDMLYTVFMLNNSR